MGAITPLGIGAAILHERWAAGECGIVDALGACRAFDPARYLTKKEIRRSSRFVQLTLGAAEEALEAAGWGAGLPYEPERVACVVGTGLGAQTAIDAQNAIYKEQGINAVSPLQLVTALPNAAAVAVQLRFGLKGESYGVAGACAAGAQAIGAALRMIATEEVDAVVVGGAESATSERVVDSLRLIGAGSKSGRSRPFDRRRDGFVLGEGAGILVLEATGLARRRGACELGRIVGYGASSDAFHVTAPAPDGAGAAQALRAALRSAGVQPTDVRYVNAHGTSTVLNDRSETFALKQVFDQHAYALQISSTKSAIGHLVGGAGAVEAIATLFALNTRTVPPTLGLEEPEEGLDLNYVPQQAQPLRDADGIPVGVSNCFGFGGHNAVVVMTPAQEIHA